VQTIYSGYGTCKELHNILKKCFPEKIFFVTGKDSYSSSGAKDLLEPVMKEFKYIRFFDFRLNPRVEDIKKGMEMFKKEKCDFVLAVGGGSVMDMGKAVSLLVTRKGKTEDYIRGELFGEERKIPSLMIPSTAGTGSESTHFSVVYIGKEKYSLSHPSLLPDYAILDPSFTENLSPYITACSGMDALCQAIESFWSVNSTEESRRYSKKAISLVFENIGTCVNKPDKKSRENMLIAANLAGKAINIAQTTAAHAVSYPITSYFNVPHGHAVALTLPYFIEFNYNISEKSLQDRRGVEFLNNIMKELLQTLEASSPEEGKEKVLNIMREINLETDLIKLGINRDNIDIIIKNGFNPQRVKNNPIILTEEALRFLLESIL